MQQIYENSGQPALVQPEIAGRLMAHAAVLRTLARHMFTDSNLRLSMRELVILHALALNTEGADASREAAIDELDRIFGDCGH